MEINAPIAASTKVISGKRMSNNINPLLLRREDSYPLVQTRCADERHSSTHRKQTAQSQFRSMAAIFRLRTNAQWLPGPSIFLPNDIQSGRKFHEDFPSVLISIKSEQNLTAQVQQF